MSQPKKPRRAGIGREVIRWTLHVAAREFGCDRRALERALSTGLAIAGEDGRFATAQIVAALYGSKEAEDLRKTRLQADQIDMENRERRKELVKSEDVYRYCEGLFIALREKVLALPCEQQDKDDMLRDMQKLTYDQIRKAPIGGDSQEADQASDTAPEVDAD